MNKTALITGAANGIGKELAIIMASKGIDMVLVSRNQGKLDTLSIDLIRDYNVRIETLSVDFGEENAPEEVYGFVNEKGMEIDYLVNNAGFGMFGEFTEISLETEKEMIQINVTALTALTKLFVKDMIKRGGGKVLNMASTASFQPGPLMSVYYATKHYVLAFSEAIAEELRGTNVTVTALCPGPTATGFQERANMGNSKIVMGKKLPAAKDVAQFGFEKMMRGNRVAIHGLMNTIMATSVRILPRNLATFIVRKISEPV